MTLTCGVAPLLIVLQIGWASPATAQIPPVSQSVSAPEIPRDKGYLVSEIRDGLYWLTDGAYGTIFLVYAKGVIAVDPLPTLGPRYLKAI